MFASQTVKMTEEMEVHGLMNEICIWFAYLQSHDSAQDVHQAVYNTIIIVCRIIYRFHDDICPDYLS